MRTKLTRILALVLCALLLTAAAPASLSENLFRADFSDRDYLLPIDFSGGKAPDPAKYSDSSTYEDSTIRVSIDVVNWDIPNTASHCSVWITDIVVRDASQLRTVSANRDFMDRYATREFRDLAEKVNAVVAINGDYPFGNEKRNLGFIVRQGILFRNNLEPADLAESRLMDILIIDEDGDFHVYHRPGTDALGETVEGKRILNAFSFGPILVENGEAVQGFDRADRWMNMAADEARQRMCICQVEPLHYRIICCSGSYRGNTGLTLPQFAQMVADQGVQTAYNLDGGDSTMIYFRGEKVNAMYSGTTRRLQDIIYFASAEGD